jgi:selenocysteine-specific elongation factor
VDRIAETSLADAAVVPLSALTGAGIEELLDRLADQIDDVPAPGQDRPRMWVDRSFPVSGAGTVVTGTLLDGELGVDETVEILPIGRTARIRSIQSHEKAHQSVGPGRRVALNLGGIDHDQVMRGHMIGLPDQWDVSRRFAVSLRTARYVDELDQRGAYQLHIGSSSHRVQITGMHAATAMFHVDTDVPVAVGDRFILRDTGRRLVVGGGRVIDPAPGRTAQALVVVRDLDPSTHPDAIATRLLEIRGHDHLSRLSAHSGGGKPVGAVIVGGRAIDLTALEALTRRATELVEKDHADHPLRSGTPLATLAGRLGVEPGIAETLVERSSLLDRIGPDVARAGHRGVLTTDQAASWDRAVNRLAESLAVPAETDLGLDPDVIGLKIRSGELIRIGPGLVYLPEQVEELKECMSTLGDGFSVAEFRDAAGLSRKYAVPILEWSDREGLTVRRGDTRRIR